MSFDIDVGGWPTISGSKATLYIDPEGPRVYTFGYVGNASWPMAAHHRIHISLGSVPLSTVPNSLKEWLEAHTDEIEALIAEYQGSEWNGSNHIGKWSDESDELHTALDQQLQEAFNQNEIQTYWDASDWYAGDPQSVISAAIGAGSIETAVENELDSAQMNGALLDPDDAEEALRTLLKEHAEDLEEDDEKLPKIEALLGDS